MISKRRSAAAVFTFALVLARLATVSPEAKANSSFSERVDDAIIGTLNHVLHSQMDCSSELPPGGYICSRDRPGELRLQGGWDSIIEPAFKLMGLAVKSPVHFVDSNMFTTAAVLYPLWMIDTKNTPLSVDRAIRLAIGNIDVHRRGEGYSFWPVLGPSSGEVDRIGPLNLYSSLLGAQIDLARRIQKATRLNFMPRDVKWIGSAFTDANSKLKKDVLFSVPSDADDTSLAVASRYYYSQDRLLEGSGDPSQALTELTSTIGLVSSINNYTDSPAHRDKRAFDPSVPGCQAMFDKDPGGAARNLEFLEKCSLDDPRERWRYDAYRETNSYSGAYMTWLYDESRELFSDPELGVILTGQNSVDCVVVANSLLAVSLSGLKNHPAYKTAYEDSCNALTNVILDSNDRLRTGTSGRNNAGVEATWRYCGLFYPAHLTFPYKLSRAVRDGGACKDLSKKEDQRRFNLALSTLLQDIVDERKGDHWEEKIDNTTQLPTALALLTLLNLGHEISRDAGITARELDLLITDGVDYLLREKKAHARVNNLPNYGMEAGTFFGGGTLNEIALWKSSAFATAAFLEAALKYRMGSHLENHMTSATAERKKLRISELLNAGSGLTSFSASEKPIDDAKFKKTYLEDALAHPDSLEKIPPVRPDRLPKPRVSHVAGSVDLGASIGTGGDAIGVLGIAMDVGTILREGETEIAYYLVRSRARFEAGSITRTPEFELSAEFMGISTNAPEVKDNVGFIPITIIREKDLFKSEAYAIHAEAQLPVVNLGKGMRLDLDIGGQLLGYAYRRAKFGDEPATQAHSAVPITLKVGVLVKKDNVGSLGISAGYALEYMKQAQAEEERRRFHAPFTAKASATYELTDRLDLYVEYTYTKDDVLYPNGENRFVGGLRGTLEKPKRKKKKKTK